MAAVVSSVLAQSGREPSNSINKHADLVEALDLRLNTLWRRDLFVSCPGGLVTCPGGFVAFLVDMWRVSPDSSRVWWICHVYGGYVECNVDMSSE